MRGRRRFVALALLAGALATPLAWAAEPYACCSRSSGRSEEPCTPPVSSSTRRTAAGSPCAGTWRGYPRPGGPLADGSSGPWRRVPHVPTLVREVEEAA